MESGLSASDVALMNRANNGYGWGEGGSFMWIFALLILFLGGNGMWGNRGGNPVTEADLCNANSFNELKGAVGRLSDQVDNVNINLTKAVCDLGYTTLSNFNQLERQLADSNCQTQRMIDGVNFNLSQATSSINTTTTAAMQKILDQMCADKAAAQAARIQQLELNQALYGVVRYPLAMTYTAGYSPFCGCGCNSCCGGQANI